MNICLGHILHAESLTKPSLDTDLCKLQQVYPPIVSEGKDMEKLHVYF